MGKQNSRPYRIKQIEVGTSFGDWTVTNPCLRKSGLTYAPCICVCGTKKLILRNNLIRGLTLGCGCKHGERIAASKTRHGMSDTPEQVTWMHMRKRCGDQKNPAFKNYGGRGIFVCDRWRNSFDNFLADMGRKPSPRHSIERINNDGPYSPENCRWATVTEQAHNKRNNIMVMFEGSLVGLWYVQEKTGIPLKTLHSRYYAGRPLVRLERPSLLRLP
jgi:hypothetical protein